MMNRPYLAILITLWSLLEPTLPEEEICPTNMKIDLYPGRVNVTWDCNVTKAMEECVYKMTLQESVVVTLDVSACFFSYDILKKVALKIHELNAIIRIYNKSHENVLIASKEVTVMPEGKMNSAAENFSCVVYNVSIVSCSWIAGREAPKDTQYSLDFRHKEKSIPCDEYRTDSFGRQVGCMWNPSNINFSLEYYVQLVGSSKDASIRFFDMLLTMKDYVILDPPRNICLNLISSSELEITWEKPETYTQLENRCFLYDIDINGDMKKDLRGNSYKTHIFPNQRIIVSMRVKWRKSCSKNTEPSRWSGLVIYDPNTGSVRLTLPHVLIILGVVTAAVLFIFIFLCHRFQVWKKLFPKVPKPNLTFLDQAGHKEFPGPNMSKMEHLPKKVDDEECICSQITEISKPQP